MNVLSNNIMTGEEGLNNFLERLMTNHFGNHAIKIHICICQYKQDNNRTEGKWELIQNFVDGKDSIERELEKCQKESISLKDIKQYPIADTGQYIVCTGVQENMKDSRLGEDGSRKDLLWLFLCDEKKESIYFLTEILRDRLMSKIDDLLLLNEMDYFEKEHVCKKVFDHKEGDSFTYYFFGDLMDKNWLVDQYVKRILREYQLPDQIIFTQISAMFYEKRSVKTSIYFYNVPWYEKKKIKGIRLESCGCNKLYKLNGNLRMIRKLMEMSGEKHGLYVYVKDQQNCIIEGIIEDKYGSEANICIKFKGNLIWQMMKGDEILFEYNLGNYTLFGLKEDELDKEICKLKNLDEFEEKTKEIVEAILNNLKEKAKHGTSIVFLGEKAIKEEPFRLISNNRGYCVNCFSLKETDIDLEGLVSIDGALMADYDGICCAVGVILDGETIVPGDPGRGARYNSVVNYLQNVKNKYKEDCFGVVISEDGMINVIVPKT